MLALPMSSFAAAKTDVSGNITSGGNKVSGATVSVTCNGHTLSDTSNGGGKYKVMFNNSDCQDSSLVTVVAHKGSQSGSNTGTVNNHKAGIDVVLASVSVPEFGGMTALIAVAVAGGAYYFMKRRVQV
jgi:hypothetical protein